MIARFGYTKNMRGGYSPERRNYAASNLIHVERPLKGEELLTEREEKLLLDQLSKLFPPPAEESEAA